MTTLDDLAFQENNLLTRIYSFIGSMEEKSTQIENAGIFKAYTDIYEQYAQFAIQEDDIEALKRALFLQWYAVSEPSCFTGLPAIQPFASSYELNNDIQLQILIAFDLLLEKDLGDSELIWMAKWYYQISEYYFEYYLEQSANLTHLRLILQQTKQEKIDQKFLSLLSMTAGRGQMSNYWKSIIHS